MIQDAIRDFLWGIVKLVLIVSDWANDMINSFIALDISSNEIIWAIYKFGLLFLIFACFFRVFFVIIKKMSDDNEDFDFGKIGKRIVYMFVVIVLVPTLFGVSMGLPSSINTIFTTNVTLGEKLTPSSSILTSIAKTSLTSTIGDMKGNEETITIDKIDDKLNDESDDEYVYFKGYGELFFCLIMGFLIAFALINVFTQVVERWFIIIFRLFIGWIPISSMIDPSDSSCEAWIKDMISDSLVQTWLLVSLWGVFAIMTIDIVIAMNGIVKLFMFWIGIGTIVKIGDIIAKYLNATNLTKGNKIGSALATMGMYGLAKGGMSALGSGFDFAKNSAIGAGAMGIQKGGQALGGKSMGDMGYDNLANIGGRNGSSPVHMQQGTFDGGSNNSSSIVDDPLSNNPSMNTNANSSNSNGDSWRLTKDNTFARRWADTSNVMPTNYGKVARGISNVGSHLYVASANRYNNTALRRAKQIVSPSPFSNNNLGEIL